MSYHAKEVDEILKEFNSEREGLNKIEVEKRISEYGKNLIEDDQGNSIIKLMLDQFNSILMYVLIVAVFISLIIGHIIDAVIIGIIVLFNGILGFVQQYKAEKSINELKKMLVPKTKVIRNGKLMQVLSTDIVPGDILIFSEGDKITADCRIISSNDLEVNESILTGESLPILKISESLKEETILAERKNMLYSGTTVVKGSCKCLVVSTGMNTEFGKIAKMIKKLSPEQTLMQKKLNKFATQITGITLLASTAIMIIGITLGLNKFDILLTAIALAISAIPEGLPAVITISLAFATQRMAKHNVIVRRLPAAESLGSVTVICSDKTGTITEEKMRVKKMFVNNKLMEKDEEKIVYGKKIIKINEEKQLSDLVKASVLCNNARFEINERSDNEKYEIIGDPTESALVLSALDLGINKKTLTKQETRIKEISFSSQRKMMSIIRDNGRNIRVYSKGASQVILERCAFEIVNKQISKLTPLRKKELLAISEKMEQNALRVLGFAFKTTNKKDKCLEEGLVFLGFIGMQDTPRKEVKNAILSCQNAGIKVKMITGDSVVTAREIAKQVGINGKVISGAELDKMSDEILIKEINEIGIFARTSPEQKLRIVEVLKTLGEDVAITGDGVNDTLALKKADIGIAMGIRGTDVARGVSDMILLDDNFASIIKAVEEGRIVYDNTKKITKYLLAVNFSEIFLIGLAILLKMPLPLLPIQILWMNIVTSSIPALTLILEKGEDVMKKGPRKEKSVLEGMIRFLIIAGLFAFLSEFIVYIISFNNGIEIGEIRSIVLTTAVLFNLFFIYTCRSDRPIFKIGFFSNKYLNYSILLSILLQIAVLYLPFNSYMGLNPLTLRDWIFILPFALSGLVIFEGYKIWKDWKIGKK